MINLQEVKEACKAFIEKCKKESVETKEAAQILIKYAKEGKISEEDEKIFKQQFYDVLKIFGIGIPFAILPGAAVLLPILIRIAGEYDIDVLPSAFNDEESKRDAEIRKELENDPEMTSIIEKSLRAAEKPEVPEKSVKKTRKKKNA